MLCRRDDDDDNRHHFSLSFRRFDLNTLNIKFDVHSFDILNCERVSRRSFSSAITRWVSSRAFHFSFSFFYHDIFVVVVVVVFVLSTHSNRVKEFISNLFSFYFCEFDFFCVSYLRFALDDTGIWLKRLRDDLPDVSLLLCGICWTLLHAGFPE